MVDLSAFEAQVKASQAQLQAIAQSLELAMTAHSALVSAIAAAQTAVPTIADVKVLVDRIAG